MAQPIQELRWRDSQFVVLQPPSLRDFLSERTFVVLRLREPDREAGDSGTCPKRKRSGHTARVDAPTQEHTHWHVADATQVHRAVEGLEKPLSRVAWRILASVPCPVGQIPPASSRNLPVLPQQTVARQQTPDPQERRSFPGYVPEAKHLFPGTA